MDVTWKGGDRDAAAERRRAGDSDLRAGKGPPARVGAAPRSAAAGGGPGLWRASAECVLVCVRFVGSFTRTVKQSEGNRSEFRWFFDTRTHKIRQSHTAVPGGVCSGDSVSPYVFIKTQHYPQGKLLRKQLKFKQIR